MRKRIGSEFVSLDGVMQAPGGAAKDTEGGFQHGGRAMPYRDDDIGNTFGALMQDVERTTVYSARRPQQAECSVCSASMCTDAAVRSSHAATLGVGTRRLPLTAAAVAHVDSVQHQGACTDNAVESEIEQFAAWARTLLALAGGSAA